MTIINKNPVAIGLLLLAAALFAAACGNDDDAADPTSTPTVSDTSPADTPTPTPTAEPPAPTTEPETPTTQPDVGEDPDPDMPGGDDGTVGAPVLPRGTSEVTIGTIVLQLHPGAVSEVDPVHVAVDDVGAAPTCAALAAVWTWSATPASNADGLTVDAIRQGGGEQVGAGPTGSADTGCMLLRFRNGGTEQVTVQVNYAIGEYGG